MGDHVKKYAKAYTAGAVVLVVGSFGSDIMTILVWLASLANITVPATVQAALTHIITAFAGGGATALTPNQNS
jgi:hypothetical protein